MRLAFGDCELDLARFELLRDGAPVAVEPRVLDVLVHLLRCRERVVSKDDLLDAVWRGETVTESALTRAVKEARRVVGDDGARQDLIRTVRGRGYRFVADVSALDDATAPSGGSAPVAERPPSASSEPEDAFVGYAQPMRALAETLAAARAGRGRLALIAGEAGIGKSFMVQQLAMRARAGGAEVWVGRCLQGADAPAFWPWTQIARSFFESREPAALEVLMGPLASDIAQVLTDLRDRLPDLEPAPNVEPAQARFRFFDAVARVFARSAASRPLVLVVDDLHRADLPSLELLRFLARELTDASVLLVGTYRDTELGTDAERARIIGDLGREPSAVPLTLQGFELEDVVSFFAARGGVDPPPELIAALHDRTGGNPFFLSQLVSLLGPQVAVSTAESGAAEVPSPASAIPGAPLPQGVREAIRCQLDGLGDGCRQVLGWASVVGREFSLPVLAAATDAEGEAQARHIDEAVAARIIAPVAPALARYRFSHALVCEVLYESLGAVERVRVHRRVGEAIEECHAADLEPHVAELAHQFLQLAPSGDVDRGVEYSRRAARQASEHFAWESAARHLERALDAGAYGRPDEERLGALLLEAAWARNRSGDLAAARAAFERAAALARARGDAEALSETALGLAAQEESGVVVPERIAALEEALEAIGPADTGLRVLLESRLSHALYFGEEPERRLARGRAAVATARRLGNRRALAQALSDFHFVMMGAGDAEERLAVAREGVELARSLGERELEGRGLIQCIEDLLELGRMPEVDSAMAGVERIAEALRIPNLSWHHMHHRAMRALFDGRYADAERTAAEALALGLRSANEVAWQFYGIQTWMLRRDQGRLDELQGEVRGLAARYPDNTGWRSAMAYWDACEGRRSEAEAGLARLVDDGLASIRRDLNWLVAPSLLAEVCFLLGDAARAAILYDAMLPFADRHVVIGLSMAFNGPVSRYLGLCAAAQGRSDVARSHLGEAIAVCARTGAWPMLAYARLDLARVELAVGDSGASAAALPHVGAARESAEKLGMRRLAEDARKLQHELTGVPTLASRRRRRR